MDESDPWTSIRIRRSTLQALREIAEKMAAEVSAADAAVNGERASTFNPKSAGVTLEAVLKRLMRQHILKRHRAREAAARRRAKKGGGDAGVA